MHLTASLPAPALSSSSHTKQHQTLAMSLDALPDELIGLICDFCNVQEIKSLRSTCRTTLKAANEHLLTEVVLFMNRESLEACKGIAAHSIFSKAALSLWIQADRPWELTFDDWHREYNWRAALSYAIEESNRVYGTNEDLSEATGEERSAKTDYLIQQLELRQKPIKSGLSDKQLGYHYTEACRLASEAEDMVRDETLSTSLQEILSNCPKIETVYLTLGNGIRACTAEKNKAFQKGLLRPFSEYDEFNSGTEVMANLVLAADHADFKPKRLYLGNVSHYIFTRDDRWEELQDFFEGLEELEWHFPIPYYNENGAIDPTEMSTIVLDFEDSSRFNDLMDAAIWLRRLHLDLPYHEDAETAVPLASVVGEMWWERLTHLHLTAFEATLDELSAFLLLHAKTLEVVFLANVVLQQGGWADCFARFAGKMPNVREFEVRGMFSELESDEGMFYWFGEVHEKSSNVYGSQISKYLIAGGEECPARPEVMEQPVP